MRIACVVGTYPCGSETFIEREIEALAARGHEVAVFPLWRAQGAQAATPPGRHVERCSAWSPWGEMAAMGASIRWQFRLLAHLPREGRAAWRALVGRGLAFEMAQRMRRQGIERVHAHFGNAPSTFGWFAADVAGLPFSFAVHARDVFAEAEFFAAKARAADRIIACNSAVAKRAAELVREADRAKIALVPHGLPLGRYPFRAELPRGEPLVLGVGRFVEKKGFACFVEAVAALRRRGRPVRCWLIGDGPERRALERQIAQLAVGDAVEIRGWLPQEELAKAYGQAAALVAPSVAARDGDMDGLPNVVVEAAALGVPLVTTDVGGLPDLVRDGETGLVAKPGDAADLAARIEAVLGDPAAALTRARRAREAVEARHDEAKTIPQLIAALGTNAR
ncbi:MAG TPA: glycosyltransferase family 4 protein [Planctomycetota bacterium]|nr:glycosyltransferase family 4 protein [Planctomycetota bacterium]HRR79110.1 glycosyltransferase family 4 protein [Planctomycetota bacterium]HRT93157.1 glycosyltransferase family 4 protein [Planctomycetota bacterium]